MTYAANKSNLKKIENNPNIPKIVLTGFKIHNEAFLIVGLSGTRVTQASARSAFDSRVERYESHSNLGQGA